jgi:chromosome segregation ATPase
MSSNHEETKGSHPNSTCPQAEDPTSGFCIVNNDKEECKEYTDCEVIKFKDIVGAKTSKDGGYFGDLLSVARANIEEAKKNGELTENAAGEVFAQAMVESMRQGVMYELQHGKTQKEIALIVAQTEYQKHKMSLERDSFDLQVYIEKGKLNLERQMTEANIRKINKDIDVMSAQIKKIFADIVHLDYQNKRIDQEIKQSNSEIQKNNALIQQIMQQIKQSEHEISRIDAEIIHIGVQDRQISQQITNMQHEVYGIDAKTVQTYVQNDQIKSDIRHTDKDTALIGKKLDFTTSQTALVYKQIDQIRCQCDNERTITKSKVGLNSAQVRKLECDCKNSTKLATSQSSLYSSQSEGFRDNARQKLFDSQLQAYSMIYEASDEVDVPTPFGASEMNSIYGKIKPRMDK